MRGPFTLSEIAAQLGGRVVGQADRKVVQVGSLALATEEQVVFIAHRRYLGELAQTRAAAVVLSPEFETRTTLPRIVTDDPYLYFARLARLLNPVPVCEPGVDAAARVHPSASVAASARIEIGATVGRNARIGERTWVGAGSYVGADAQLGEDCRLYPNVVVYDGCLVGARTVLHAGAVIGADGFGYAKDGERWNAIPQIGRVVLGNDVDVGANTTIDRGTIEDTVIEDGVKLDDQIHVAHNVRIGANTAIAACTGIAGSTVIGRNCEIGGAAMIRGHIRIADGTRISPATAITHSLRAGTYTGIFPFDDHVSWRSNAAVVRQLAKLLDRVRALEKRLSQKESNSD
jgi:UDP-3-O-[3-hydroxymyristoyl] glucosamine N-acyltransferase